MKIKDAQQTYRTQIQAYRTQKAAIAKKQEALKKKMESTVGGSELFGDEAAVLQLTYDALDKKQNEYSDYLEKLNEQKYAIEEMENSKQQGEAVKEAGADMAKIMEVARRIMKGARVPASDERKLMEFDDKLYQMAKNVGAMVKLRKRKKYDSLWDDEKKKEQTDPSEIADNTEAAGIGPEIIRVEDTIAEVAGSEGLDLEGAGDGI